MWAGQRCGAVFTMLVATITTRVASRREVVVGLGAIVEVHLGGCEE